MELARRDKTKTPPTDATVREALAGWYDVATLDLLKDSPVNCLLVTWSAGADSELERRQQRLVKAYAGEAHKRGVAVLGVVYAGSDPSKFVPAAADAQLDGLVLDGEFSGEAALVGQLEKALASANSTAFVIPIVQAAASARKAKGRVSAVRGVSPGSRNLADMGIRSGPSTEPWIESNIWVVRSFRLGSGWRPVWIGQQPDAGSVEDYARCVADAAVAGGRWIVALDEGLRAKLRRNDPSALATWQRIGAVLKFAEDHAEWRSFEPYGNLGIVLDTASENADISDEYLNLVARRQVPYRLIGRSQLSARSLAGFRAVLAAELSAPTEAERSALKAFAENGGLVVAGPWWGNPPKDDSYAEIPLGKGRVAVYKDPDPESVARDMRDLLSSSVAGVVAFNVPSVITYASSGGSGKPLLVQLLNYSNSPATAITIRVIGSFRTAHWYTLDAAPSDLSISSAEGHTDVTIPKLSLWGGVLLEQREVREHKSTKQGDVL